MKKKQQSTTAFLWETMASMTAKVINP